MSKVLSRREYEANYPFDPEEIVLPPKSSNPDVVVFRDERGQVVAAAAMTLKGAEALIYGGEPPNRAQNT